MSYISKFIRDESGIATLDWVAISAGAMLLALGVFVYLQPALFNAATDLANLIRSF